MELLNKGLSLSRILSTPSFLQANVKVKLTDNERFHLIAIEICTQQLCYDWVGKYYVERVSISPFVRFGLKNKKEKK